MNLPKISIITPSYNQGCFLEETILSVLDQNYPNIEYIVIDGGSYDNTLDILNKYNQYIHCWVSEKDRGQTHAINKGLRIATGDIIAYLNSDDMYFPNTFEIVSNYFISHPDEKFIYGNIQIIDSEGRIIKNKRQPDFDYVMGCMIGFGLIIDQPAAFWRRPVLNNIGYFNENLQYNMDGDYWTRVAQEFKCVHIDHYLAKFRWHKESKSICNKDPNPQFISEKDIVIEQGYNTLKISKYIPYQYSKPIRYLYRSKRIISRLAARHYLYV